MDERERRRRERADKIVFAKARSFEEHEAQGREFWQRVSPADKLDAIAELVKDSWYVAGNDGPPPRLDRLAHGVRKLRG